MTNKVYTIKETHAPLYSDRVRVRTCTGTLDELIEYYSYTLEVGASWQNERGNKKINRHPATIRSLLTNLSNAKNNAARNGYSGYSYELVG